MSGGLTPAQEELAALFAAVEIPLRDGACVTPAGTFVDRFFPVKAAGTDNHGAVAKSICAGCSIREACLSGALRRNEENGIWGGAGEQRRRTLRRAQANDREAEERTGVPGTELAAAWAAHWRALDGCPEDGDALILAGFGPNATHGNAATYAKGCRCEPCCLAVALRTAGSKLRTRPKKPRTTTGGEP